MGIFRDKALEIDLEGANDIADKLIVASQELDKTATRLSASAADARRAAAELRRAFEQVRLQAGASRPK